MLYLDHIINSYIRQLSASINGQVLRTCTMMISIKKPQTMCAVLELVYMESFKALNTGGCKFNVAYSNP